MVNDLGARGRNIMEYVRHLEGRVTELRGIQSRFKLYSFALGILAGWVSVIAGGWLYFFLRHN